MTAEERACTCHPSEAPDLCQHRYAYSDCLRAALVERVARAMCEANFFCKDPDEEMGEDDDGDYIRAWQWNARYAEIAIDLIRAEVLEEAAKVAENTPHWTDNGPPLGKMPTGRDDIAAAIRALKSKP